MKVAIITRDYPPYIGGISTHAGALVAALRDLGIDVDVFAGHSDIRTLLMPLTKKLRDYDIIHVLSAPYGAFAPAVPLVVTVHAPILVEFPYYTFATKLNAILALVLEQLTLRRAHVILAVSETTKNYLVRKCGQRKEKVEVVGNGVDYGRFRPEKHESRFRNRILMISRLEPRKNLEEAIRALSELPPDAYDAEIVGDGSQRSRLQHLAQSLGVTVRFTGRVGEESLPEFYRRAGIFLSTSKSEGFNLSLLEAMAAGCAALASDISAHREFVRHGVDGLLFANHQALVATLKELLADTDLQKTLGLNASLAAEAFSWQRVASRVLGAYGRCLAGSPIG